MVLFALANLAAVGMAQGAEIEAVSVDAALDEISSNFTRGDWVVIVV